MRRRFGSGITLVEMMIVIVVIGLVAAFVASSCGGGLFTNEATLRRRAVTALENQGFTDAKIQDVHWFGAEYRGCSRDDNFAIEATALNPRNRRVNVIVCMGWPFKGATVRTAP